VTRAPVFSESAAAKSAGVRTTDVAMRSAAASMSATVTGKDTTDGYDVEAPSPRRARAKDGVTGIPHTARAYRNLTDAPEIAHR
jgi:hypothetical protein